MNFEYIEPNREESESGLTKVYELLGAHTPLEMSNLYGMEDQKLMKSGGWDYDDHDLITNKVKVLLEQLDPAGLTVEEADWRNEVLWFWYHHAISCAIAKNDQEAAQHYANRALQLQSKDHPNKITKLLSYLVNDKLTEAEEWLKAIDEDPEKATAEDLIACYKEKGFFKTRG